jgi:D-tyrosyl-tRNA(Tyr) deacylase
MDVYRITSAFNGQVVAISTHSLDQYKPLIEYPYTGDPSQQWELVPIEGDRYKIVSCLSSQQVVAVSTHSQDQYKPLIEYPYTGDPSQQWELAPVEGNYFKIVSATGGQVMAVSTQAADEHKPLIAYPYAGVNSQEWQVVWIDEEHSICKIVSLCSGQVVAVSTHSQDQYKPLIEYPYTGDPSQQWELVPIEGNRYKIVSRLSSQQVVAVSTHSQDQYRPLIEYPYTGDPSQQWELVPLQLSTIKSVATNQVMAVSTQSQDLYKPLIEFPYGGDSSQQWQLIPVSLDPLTEEEIRKTISRYGPILKFHPNEKNLMCSVEWFLGRAVLHDDKTNRTIPSPKVDQLPTGPKENGRYWLTLADDAKGGNLPTAKAYVHAYAPPGRSYTDLQFYIFYAYNGPGTLHLFTTISEGDASLQPLGEHVGDWETCVLRIDNASKSLIGVWMSQHGSGQWLEGSQLEQLGRDREQIILYSSLNGHAIYPAIGPNPTHEGDYLAVSWFLRNDTDDGGQILDCSTRYNLVSAPSIVEPKWLDYPYRWGPENTHTQISPEQAYEIVLVALGKLSFLVPKEIAGVIVEQIITSFYTDNLNGPDGPKQKDAWCGKYDNGDRTVPGVAVSPQLHTVGSGSRT